MDSDFAQPVLPTVLVVLGNYRQSDFIADALHSIKNQSYPHFKCVVVDDNSADGSVETIVQLLEALDDERFSFTQTSENSGQMAAMLHGLAQTDDGDFVAFMDADDFWREDYLLCHVAMHLNIVQPVAVTSSNMFITDGNKQVQGAFRSARNVRRIAARTLDVAVLFNRGSLLERFDYPFDLDGQLIVDVEPGWIWSATSGMVFRRAAVEACVPDHPESIPICADAFLVQAAHMLGGTLWIQQPLGYYRVHGDNGFSKGRLTGLSGLSGNTRPDVQMAIEAELAAWVDRARTVLDNKHRYREILRRRKVVALRAREPQWLYRPVAFVFKRYLGVRDWLKRKRY